MRTALGSVFLWKDNSLGIVLSPPVDLPAYVSLERTIFSRMGEIPSLRRAGEDLVLRMRVKAAHIDTPSPTSTRGNGGSSSGTATRPAGGPAPAAGGRQHTELQRIPQEADQDPEALEERLDQRGTW